MSEMKDVRVKALEWVELGFAHTSTGVSYRILREPGYWKLEKHEGPSTTNSAHANEDAAKAAAQADYERRILAALEPAAKPKYTARDAFLSLTDGSNWPEMKGDYFSGYQDAMEQVHQHVMDFWPELSATDLPEPSPKPAGGEWVTVPHPDQTSPMTVGPEEFLDEPEAAAWDWLDKTFANAKLGHHPNDRDYSPDEMVDAFIAGRASINVAAPPSPAASPSSGEVVEALKLHVAYEALPTDRGGKNGPKGQAWQAFIAARDAALAKIGGDHDK